MAERKPSQQAIKGEARPKDDVDLATILDEAQRADLTLLVANITESMRKEILDNFDSQAGLDKSLLREGMTEDEKMMVADPANADVSAYDRERKLKEESEKDLATLKMKTLKKHVLKAYDEWREQVILRVGQVVNSERTAKEQVQKNAGKADMARPQATDTIGKVMDAPTKTAALKFKDLFPPTKTPLTKLPMDKRTLILHSVLLLLLSLEHYNAYSRVLMLNLTSSLKLPLKTFEQDEYTTAKGLLEAAKEMTADEERRKKADENKESRKWKVGLATAAGAAIIGVTGGLAAPLVAAGVGSVMGGLGLGATTAAAYLGTVAGSSVVVGGLFGAYGGRMTGQMMDNYAREVEDFQFLPVHGSSNKKTSEDDNQGPKQASEHDHKLRVTVGISGWLTEKEEVVKPWRVLGTGAEVFALKYELEALLNLGNAMNGMVRSAAWGYAQKEIIQRTIFAELAAALWPIGLLKVARVIDNPFSVAKSRAEKAGEVLADALVNRAQGERPVTLIGYSLGARVIYTCLMNLAKRKEFGIVENAVLIGSPTPSDTSDWRVLRSVVAGRLVNVFSVNDYILGFMYRTSAIQFGVAGLQKVEGLSGVENFDVSEDVNSHQRYRYLIGAILKKIGFEDIDMAAVEEEQQALLKLEEDEKKQSLLSQRKALQRRESTGGKQDEAAEAEAEADELEQQVQDQTQKSLVTRAIEYFYVPGVPSTKETEKTVANLKEAGRDPSQAGNIAGQTAQAARDSTQSYASRLYKSLPSMPYANRPTQGTTAQDTAGQASKAGEEIGIAGQDKSRNYIKQASSYLQSLPSSMPSFPRGSSNKTKSQAIKSPEPATTAVDSAKSGANTAAVAAKDTAGVVSDTVTPTVRNTLDPKDNPAVKPANRAADKAPIIHQAKDRTPAPVKNAAGDVSDTVGTTAQNAGQTAQKGLDTATGKAGEARQAVPGAAKAGSQAILPAAADGQDSSNADPGKGAGAAQSYTSRATAYLPNLNVSMPSLGFGGSGGAQAGPKNTRANPPKLEKRPSGPASASSSSRPDLTKTPSGTGTQRTGGVKSPLPKLNRAPPSGSGVKSPPPKLDRLPSGIKSPPANLERLPSGVKSPQPPKLDRLPAGPNKSASAIASPSPGIQTPPTSVPSPSLGAGRGGGLASQAQSHAQSQVDKLRVGSPASASLPKLPPRRQSSNQQQQQQQSRTEGGGSGSDGGRGGGASAANVLPAVPGADMLKHAATDAASETVKQGSDMLSGMGRAVGFGR
ncbi:putative membrane protein C6F6.13c [Exophiala dermatitidis]